MARKARGATPDGVYHIQQRSTPQKSLFETDADRMKFLELLNNTKQKYGIKLYAYCLEDRDTYHLIIHPNGSDLSKMMKSLNIAYAMYVGCEGPLFKDRYKSALIGSACEFESVKTEIRESKMIDAKATAIDSKASRTCFNSDPKYCDDDNPFEAICTTCIRTSDEAFMKLQSLAKNHNLEVEALITNKEIRNDLIIEFRKASLLSLKDLGALFGGLSESSVSKILKSSCNEVKDKNIRLTERLVANNREERQEHG